MKVEKCESNVPCLSKYNSRNKERIYKLKGQVQNSWMWTWALVFKWYQPVFLYMDQVCVYYSTRFGASETRVTINLRRPFSMIKVLYVFLQHWNRNKSYITLFYIRNEMFSFSNIVCSGQLYFSIYSRYFFSNAINITWCLIRFQWNCQRNCWLAFLMGKADMELF